MHAARFHKSNLFLASACALAFAFSAPAQDKDSAGAVFSKQATAKEVGLPLYPGAKPHKDDADESPAANLGLWGGNFGFKLAVLKLETKDAPEKLAAFYRKALGKYGKVLTCSGPDSRSDPQERRSSNQLTCDEDQPDAGGMVFKAGTKDKQHLVEIKPTANGLTVFTLLRIEMRGTDQKEAL